MHKEQQGEPSKKKKRGRQGTMSRGLLECLPVVYNASVILILWAWSMARYRQLTKSTWFCNQSDKNQTTKPRSWTLTLVLHFLVCSNCGTTKAIVSAKNNQVQVYPLLLFFFFFFSRKEKEHLTRDKKKKKLATTHNTGAHESHIIIIVEQQEGIPAQGKIQEEHLFVQRKICHGIKGWCVCAQHRPVGLGVRVRRARTPRHRPCDKNVYRLDRHSCQATSTQV
jgi:hypothetical protein